MPESNEASVDFNFQSGEFKANQPAPEPDPQQTEEPTPQRRNPVRSGDWLDGLLGGLDSEEDPDPEAEEEADPDSPLDKEEQAWLKANPGGKLADYYKEKYSAAPADQADDEQTPKLTPEEERLKLTDDAIAVAKKKVTDKMREQRRAIQLGLSDNELDALEEEIADLNLEVSRLANRREGLASRVQDVKVTSLRSAYEEGFVERMVTDHGLSRQQADKVRGRILQDPRIEAMLGQENTRQLLEIPLAREVFIKAALYDMQYNTKKQRRAPGDPAPRGGRSAGGAPQQRSRSGEAFASDDRDFAAQMRGERKDNK